MEENRQITMKDIARELGISVATVSRALADSHIISKQRREMIQAYAREHNFTPNSIAKDLRNTKKKPVKVIGVIIPELVHFFFASVLDGIEAEASKHGYRIMVAQSKEDFEREVKICNSFYENRVCGIIVSLAKGTKQYDHFVKLQANGVPLVFYDRICHGINASRVVVDDYHGAFKAVCHLIDTGCKRIAFYGSMMNLEISKNRFNGYKDALLKHKIPYDESIIRMCDNRQDAEVITPEILSMENRPDAFFAINDDTAVGILYTAKNMGLRIPEDISICGFTNSQRARATEPMLTTVDQHGYMVGSEAVAALLSIVEGEVPKDKLIKKIVRTELIIGGTTRN